MVPLPDHLSFQIGPPLIDGWLGVVFAILLLIVPVAIVGANSRETPRWLIALRLVAILLAWSLAVFEPVLVHRRMEETPGQTLLAIDLSSSMDAADPQRTADEKSRLLEATGLSDAATLDRLSRRDIVDRLLQHSQLVELLEQTNRVKQIGFTDKIVSNLSLEKLPSDADGAIRDTDLRVPLQDALSLAADRSMKTLGVIVVSDGQQTKGPLPVDVARELRATGVPIYAVAVGSRVPPRDVAVIDIAAPKTLFKDAEGTVEAKIRVRGMSAQQIAVDLFDVGPPRKRLDRKMISHAGPDEVVSIRFPIKFDQTGLKRLEVVAAPQGSESETTTGNNSLAALVRVGDDKMHILLVSDEVGWEMHYLTTALVRDTDMKVDRIVFHPPRLQPLGDEDRQKAGLPADRWPPLEPGRDDPLWAYSAIVLGDIALANLSLEIQQRLEKYVTEREGTLIVLAGKREPDAESLVTKMLPIEKRRRLVAKEGYQVTPTDAGWRLPFTALDDAEVESRRRWSELPPLVGGSVGATRPGAIALAIDTKSPDDALMAMGNVGLGRVIWIGADNTWRWRYRVGDRDHQRFWGQLVRWAGSESSSPEIRGGAAFGAKSPVFAPGQPVEVFLNVGSKGKELTAARYRIVAISDDGKERDIAAGSFRKHDDRPRLWEASIPILPPGSYRVTTDVDGAVAPNQRDRFTITPSMTGELADLATNADALRTLATESGGRFFWADEIDQLPRIIERQLTTSEVVTEERLSGDPPWIWWVLGIVLGVLTIEWIGRKRVGLP